LDTIIPEDELKLKDGQAGHPAYVAYKGVVYDVSASTRWRGGLHMRRHNAGQDLTSELPGAPHDESVFQKVPAVGKLPAPKAEAGVDRLTALLDWFFDLDPHPVAAHFPVAYSVTLAVLFLAYLLLGHKFLESVAYYGLWGTVVMTPVTMLAGALTWWFNYGHKFTRKFILKMTISAGLLILAIIALVLRTASGAAPNLGQATGWLYLLILALMVVAVAVLGWIGTRIRFPARRRRGNLAS
jgi:predicted heme/steroid binding protein/uncharacterized membrane protein